MIFNKDDSGRYFIRGGELWRCIGFVDRFPILDRVELVTAHGAPPDVRQVLVPGSDHANEFKRVEQWLPGDIRPHHEE